MAQSTASSFISLFPKSGQDVMGTDMLDLDLAYLLSLQPASEASSLQIDDVNTGYVNVPTPAGSLNTLASSSWNMDFAMEDNLMFPISNHDSPFQDYAWDPMEDFEFAIDPVVKGDGLPFDMSLDIEPLLDSTKGTNATSQCNSWLGSSNDLQYLGQNSGPVKKRPWDDAVPLSENCIHAASVPSPNPTLEIQSTRPTQNLTFARPSRPPKKRPAQTPPENKWIFITQDKTGADLPKERTGIRRGQLPAQTRKKARRIREIGACWKCWVQKVPCSEGAPCETCTKHFLVLAPQMCCRTRLHEYVPVFFPDYLHSHFGKKKVEDLINAHSHGFTDTVVDIAVSTGLAFEPMKIKTNIFVPKTWELIGHYQLVEVEAEPPRFVERYSAPLGIMGLHRPDVTAQCRKHIEEMISNPEYVAQVTAGHKTGISAAILEVARKYDAATKGASIVHEALMLHGIHHFMSSMLTLTEESKSRVYQIVEHIGAPPGEYLTSRLLNRQIKYVMHLLHREVYQSVLEGLEKSLKSNTKKDSWGASFCALLLLCLCIEELQTAADLFVVSDMRKDGASSAQTRRESTEACTALEEYPFQQSMTLFHDVYRSRREAKTGGGSKDGLNPFRNIASDARSVSFGGPTDEMVNGMHSLICNAHEEILELATRPSMLEEGFIRDLNEIKVHNTGRVAAKFLNSFLENVETP